MNDTTKEALRQIAYAIKQSAQVSLTTADALLLIVADAKAPTNDAGGAASPPKVEGEAVARGTRTRKAAGDPPPPAAVAPAAPAPAPKALDYDRDVKPLVVKVFEKQSAEQGQPAAIEANKKLLAGYGAEVFGPKPGKKHVDPSLYPRLVEELQGILTGASPDDNELGL